MAGHLNNEKATKETIDDEGWLHTGDLARVDANGCVYIVDGLKELIKYKGYQVPPAELEAVLLSHPGIADAAVIGVNDDEGEEVPKAFVVKQFGTDLTADEVTEFVAGQVAPHKTRSVRSSSSTRSRSRPRARSCAKACGRPSRAVPAIAFRG
jgi:acyl-CoA synthetase (AMP-forming)/AMP-acid ligase II